MTGTSLAAARAGAPWALRRLYDDLQHPLRATAESANRTIDDHLPRERLLHYGFERNTISMYAWQAYRNTLTAAVFASTATVAGADPPAGQIAA